MDWLHYLVASVFVIIGVGCVLLVAINLPGTWIMLAPALLIELLDGLYRSDEPAVTFGWWVLAAATVLAIVGEIVEFASGAAGSKFGGGGRRGMIGATIGGLLGALIFTPLVPIPLLGTLVGATLGTFAGALVAEMTGPARRNAWRSLRPATGAAAGRIVGNIAKTAVASAMWLLLSIAAFWP